MPGICADFGRIEEDWQEWAFPQLIDTLRKWTTRNPKIIPSPEKVCKHENAYQTNDKNYRHCDNFFVRNLGIKAVTAKQ